MQIKDRQPSAVAPRGPSSSEGAQGAHKAERLSLFAGSSFTETPASVTFPDGTSINIPQVSDADLQQAKGLFGGLSDADMAAMMSAGNAVAIAYNQAAGTPGLAPAAGSDGVTGLRAAPMGSPGMQTDPSATPVQPSSTRVDGVGGRQLSQSQAQSGSTATAAQLTGGSVGPTAVVGSPAVVQALGNAGATFQAGYQTATGGKASYDQTVQAVTFSGVMGLQNQLSDYAKYVQGNINQQNAIQGQAEDINSTLADWPKGKDGKPAATVKFQITEQDIDTGAFVTHTKELNQAQARAMYSSLRSTLSTMTSQTQTDQLALQNMSQNYAQGINTISNLMKMNFDTVKGIIGNIRAG